MLSRRELIAAALAASAAACATPGRGARPLRLTLLGQALITNDLCRQDWPALPGLAKRLSRADVVFTDLEAAVRGPRAGAITRDPEFLHDAEPVVLDCLKRLNVSLLAHANNHAFDLGTGGILDALDAMGARGFVHAGTGRTLDEARAPAVQQTPHGSVALVALATGRIREGGAAAAERPGVHEVRLGGAGEPHPDDMAGVTAALRQAAARADVAVLYHHNHEWGADNTVTPEWQKAFARRCVEAGASVYVSHGAPLLHGIELHRGAPIFYGLGSFIFQTTTAPGRYPDVVWDSVIAECEFAGGRFAGARLVPVRMNDTGAGGPTDFATRGRPIIARAGEGRRILRRLQALSAPYAAPIELLGDEARLRPG